MVKAWRDGKYCHWCRRPLRAKDSGTPEAATTDHVIPVSKGGQGGEVVWSCIQCNSVKSGMMPEAWKAWVAVHPG